MRIPKTTMPRIRIIIEALRVKGQESAESEEPEKTAKAAPCALRTTAEQSLNVALSVADRAIFLEKGQVRFEGPAQELLERDDLARAVFLGKEGG